MTAEETIRFFLGANSPQGFYSLYDQLIPPERARAVYILKGGPGCGKSSLMRRVAQRAQEAGDPGECICCSGDPDSLDAVVLPRRKTATWGAVPSTWWSRNTPAWLKVMSTSEITTTGPGWGTGGRRSWRA